ncbi:ABC transporter ATP-binding protein [Ideonella alba]|uniref:ABC transporter ATP-binding protein n=1 Tax=Ideonella alba TaxID=2824118 RepID=A0A940YA82_9BURK|nr:ABC transporter ATP-binding protein [Ideonella alba]MBQ0929022.1 ABC transporter ATP-binding protein [Ideonella alba]
MTALSLQTFELGKRFGSFTALQGVSLAVRPGTVHALLGENGAGKSTLVKCIVGYQRPDEGAVLVDGREQDIHSPTVARDLGLGMVYQHFTVVPGMTVAENLLLARGRLPMRIDWRSARAELEAFLQTTPFRLPLDATPLDLSAGEKQKLEILKQLFLKPRLLILDEPTSVLTPQEADEVLGALREQARSGACSVLMITHKFREVMAHADDVSVLRRGRLVHSGAVADTTPAALAEAMVGEAQGALTVGERSDRLEQPPGETKLAINALVVMGDRGEPAVRGLDLQVRRGEIVGVAGVSGNGQRELMQALTGQRARLSGRVQVDGRAFGARRAENRHHRVRSLPEEPLANACVGALSVAQNMALRHFDERPWSRAGWVRWGALRARARQWIAEYGVKTQGERAAIRTLSGGNVQRAVLARELDGQAELLLVSNPVFGLDFAAVAEIHGRLMAARNRGAAVLLVSEDLDELLSLADRIVVMSEGRVVHDTPARSASRQSLGAYMGGRAHGPQETHA